MTENVFNVPESLYKRYTALAEFSKLVYLTMSGDALEALRGAEKECQEAHLPDGTLLVLNVVLNHSRSIEIHFVGRISSKTYTYNNETYVIVKNRAMFFDDDVYFGSNDFYIEEHPIHMLRALLHHMDRFLQGE